MKGLMFCNAKQAVACTVFNTQPETLYRTICSVWLISTWLLLLVTRYSFGTNKTSLVTLITDHWIYRIWTPLWHYWFSCDNVP